MALKYLGYSYNTTDEDQIREAAEMLKKQKPLVQAYVMDQIFDKMENGEAAIATYYVGDYYLMVDELGEDSEVELGFYIPKEGSNLYVDAVCIPKGAQNKEGAEAFIDFLLRPEVMAQNTECICYSTAEAQPEHFFRRRCVTMTTCTRRETRWISLRRMSICPRISERCMTACGCRF